jgi:hypothetical protein
MGLANLEYVFHFTALAGFTVSVTSAQGIRQLFNLRQNQPYKS